MADFSITLTASGGKTRAQKLAGVAAARAAYNAALPQTVAGPLGEGGEETQIANPALKATDADYMQFVIDNAAESYANQYDT